jgi:hypothetical protein
MAVQESAGRIDFEVLRRAYEQRDAELALSLYADGAEVRMVDHNNPPSSPLELNGKEQIGKHLRDVLSREMTHRIENEVIGKDRAAFNIACQYPNGGRVYCAAMLEVRDDKIVREVGVQAWDE